MTIPELTLTGTPREKGRAHGETLRDEIEGAIDTWFDHLSEHTNPHDFVAELTHVSGLREAAEGHTPDLVEEVTGLSEGAAQSFEAMFAWQTIDEAWWYLDEITTRLGPAEACSAFAVNHDGRGLVGQTQDLPRHYDGYQIMLRRIEDGREVLAPSIAGLLALNGVNSHGLAVCITTLSQLAHSTSGVSSGFVVPALLRCRDIDDALAFLQQTPIASGNSFVLGTRDRSVVVEVSADALAIVDDGERALHTNHTLSLDPVREYVRFEGSVDRLDQLRRAVGVDSTVTDVAATYSTGHVCRSRAGDDPTLSVGTMFFELADDQVCHYAPGPLDTDELVAYRVSGG